IIHREVPSLSPLSQVHAPVPGLAAHAVLRGGGGDRAASQCAFVPGPFPLLGPDVGGGNGGWRRGHKAACSSPGDRGRLCPLLAPCPTGCLSVKGWSRWGVGWTTEDRSPCIALVATFAASAVCPEPAPNTPRLTVSCTMGSELETAMETLINVFHAHSGKEGDKYKLSKKELKELLQTELSGFLDAQKDADAVDKVMKELDENGDGEVDFQEYVVLVAALTVACNNFFWENS
uniref:Protein S100-A1 n=1 Tax=Sus scrofa TaxID=9823 RepID=A0A4X1W2E9_PIG